MRPPVGSRGEVAQQTSEMSSVFLQLVLGVLITDTQLLSGEGSRPRRYRQPPRCARERKNFRCLRESYRSCFHHRV